MLQNFLIGRVAQGNRIEVVFLHELVENVGTEHHRLRNLHAHAGKSVKVGMPFYNAVEKGQSASFSAERTVADTRKMGIFVETASVEHSHDSEIFHVAILHNRVENNLSRRIDILQLRPLDRLEELRNGENRPRRQPSADVVARHMVEHRLVGNLENAVLQLLQILHTGNFLAVDFLEMFLVEINRRIAENEVAETHVFFDDPLQVEAHLLRVFIDKMKTFGLGFLTILAFGTLHDERQKFVVGTNRPKQFQTCLSVFFNAGKSLARPRQSLRALHREAHVADHAQNVVGIAFVDVPSLLVTSRQHHFRSSAHSQRGGMVVQRLGRKTLTLHQYIMVEVRQNARIEADRVLDEQNHLHTGLLDVVFEVHAVLNQLDNRENQVRVAKPAEHIVENREVLVGHPSRDAVRERRQHHAAHVGTLLLDLPCHRESVVVGVARHRNYQVDVRRLHHLARLLNRRNLRKRRRIAQSEFHILVVNLLLHAPVVLKHESVVRIRHNQHVVDSAHHQIDKRHVFQQKFAPVFRNIRPHCHSIRLIFRAKILNFIEFHD